MVYCVKCGNNNPDEAQVCSKCGAKLYVTGRSEHYKRMENECFGIPKGGTIVGLAIGIIILLAGGIALTKALWPNLLPEGFDIGPFALVIFGILIIIGAVYGMRRRF